MTYRAYGAPDVLQLTTVARPVPEAGEVLVQVHAASLNQADLYLLRGEPWVARLSAGLRRPKRPTLGADIAGQVVAVGGGVTQFQPGDAVYGDLAACGFGGFAEYACVREEALAPKPSSLSFAQAAAVPAVSLARGVTVRGLVARPSREDLMFVGQLLDSGAVVPVIDRRYPLGELPEAMRYLAIGHARGKVVIALEQASR